MLEYTIFVIIALFVALILDFLLQTKVILKPRFWLFLVIVIILQTIVDNYLNGRWFLDSYLVGPYGEQFYSGIKIIETPLENYLFGIALIWNCVSVFEFYNKKDEHVK